MSESNIEVSVSSSELLAVKMENLQFALAMIEQLKGGMALRRSWNEVKEIVDALIYEIPFIGYKIDSSSLFFRGRIENNHKLLRSTTDFSYKPVDMVSEYGRCHTPNSSIFYSANNLDTVFSELSPEIGDIVHVGMAKVNNEAHSNLTAIGEIDHIRRYNKPFVGNNETKQILNDTLFSFGEAKKTRALLVDAFFADIFAQPALKQREYKITSALAKSILESKHTNNLPILDGFAYPSVAHRGGINFVITPSAFDEKYYWNHFMAFEITDYLGFGLYACRQYAKADTYDNDQIINWEEM